MKMNLNIMIKEMKNTALLFAILFGCFSNAQQNLISWEVADPQLNRKFIELYLNNLSRTTSLSKTQYKLLM